MTKSFARHSLFAPAGLPADEWHHGALSYDGTTLRLYLDGLQVAEKAVPGPLALSPDGTRLGQITYQGNTFGAWSGKIAETRVWNRALAPSEIQLHKGEAITFAPGLVARWGFNAASGDTLASEGANGPLSVLRNGAVLSPENPPQENLAPSASITSPTAATAVTPGTSLSLTADASDLDDSVTKVEFFANHQKIGEDSDAPYQLSWVPSTTGEFQVRAVAHDAAGRRNGSANNAAIIGVLPSLGNTATYFGGESSFADTVANPAHDLPHFTIETRFYLDGDGKPVALGPTGPQVVSLLARGSSVFDTNYLLGIAPVSNLLVAGFGSSESFLQGRTPITRSTWHHAAAAFDGEVLRIYLDRQLEGEKRFVNAPPLGATKRVTLAGMRTSVYGTDATFHGLFQGALDEARLWNHARSAGAIAAGQSTDLPSAPGLISRWSMDAPASGILTATGAAPGDATLAPRFLASGSPIPPAGVPPTVALDTPAAAASVPRDSVVQLEATAADADGNLARVEFWSQFGKLGEDATAPFTFSWSAAPVGTHQVSATAIDTTGLANTSAPVTVTVNPVLAAGGLYLDGLVDRAYHQDGGYDFPQGKFTAEGWFRREGPAQTASLGSGFPEGETLLSLENSSIRFFVGFLRSSNTLCAGSVAFEGKVFVTGNTPIPVGVWFHLALSFDGSRLRLFLNGVEYAAGNVPLSALTLNSTVLSVGGAPYISSNFRGFVDELRLWDYDRAESEIAGTRGLLLTTAPGLISHWAFNEGFGTSSAATGSSPRNLTFSGSDIVWSPGVTPVAGTPPAVTITSPAAQSEHPILASVNVTASASDADGTIARLEAYFDGAKVGEDSSPPFQFTFTGQNIGTKYLTVVATDDAGLAGTHRIALQMNPPTGTEGLYFDGVDDYVRIQPIAPGLATETFTVEAWVRRDGPGLTGPSNLVPIVARGSNFLLGIDPNTGKLRAEIGAPPSGQPSSLSGDSVLAIGEWRHIALTYDRSTVVLYVDGQVDATASGVFIPSTSPNDETAFATFIYQSGITSGAFHGYLDEARIWGHARPAAVIAADRWRTDFTNSGVLARWGFNESAGLQALSQGSQNAPGSITGARRTIGRPPPSAPTPITTVASEASPQVGQPATLVATPSASSAVTRVDFYVNGVKAGEATASPWSISFLPSSPGRYIITAVTTSAAGGIGASNDLVWDVLPSPGTTAVYLDGIDDYVEMPASEDLALTAFTAETWFRQEGSGRAGLVVNSTRFTPVLTHGSAWYVAIRATDRRLVAGWPSRNISSLDPIENGRWYHVAFTTNGTSLKLYLDGVLQGSATLTAAPTRSTTTSVGLGTAFLSDGSPQGSFHGLLDETRLWSIPLTDQQVIAYQPLEIQKAPSLVGRWADCTGSSLLDSSWAGLHAQLIKGAMPASGVLLTTNDPPQISAVAPADEALIPSPVSLRAQPTGIAGESLATQFHGREIPRDAREFTIAILPSISNYTGSVNGGSPTTLNAMLDWIVANRDTRNIVFVAQTGEVIPIGNTNAWTAATSAFSKLENPDSTGLPHGIPYGLGRASSDVSYDTHFGPARFAGKPSFVHATAGAHAAFFRAGGADIGILFISNLNSSWLENIVTEQRHRQFIVVHHDVLGSSGWSQTLRNHPNIVAAFGGRELGEKRSIVANNEVFYHAISARYSDRPNGGDGWLRLLTFSPLEKRIHVQTYSPTRNEFEVDSSSDFSIGWNPPQALSAPLALPTQETSGSAVIYPWSETAPGRRYQWFATTSDGLNTSTTGTREFVTTVPAGATPPVVSLTTPTANLSATLPSVIPIAVEASSSQDTIERTELLINGVVIDTDSILPSRFRWAPGAPGTYQMRVAAIDRRGLRTESPPITATISPSTGATLSASIANATALTVLYDTGSRPISVTTGGSATNISRVEFYVNDELVATDQSAPYEHSFDFTAGSQYRLEAIAFASTGQSASTPVIRTNVVPLPAASTTREPYLQLPAPNAVTVCWRSSVPYLGRVRYGTDPTALTSSVSASSATNHAVRVTGLLPNTRYYYSIGSPSTVVSGADPATYFTTPPPAGRARHTRIWAQGDFGSGNAGQASTRDAFYNFTGARGADIMLLLGDNAYPSGSDTDYQTGFFNMYPTLLRRTFTWPALGNHDTAGSTLHNPNYPYYSIFNLPTAAESGGVPSGTERYYSFDHANIHFVCLDSMTTDRSVNAAMATWLRSDLAATNARWIIAYWHHPPYSKGGWDSDTNNDQIQMRTNLVPILEEFGVDLVLSGHSHNYERSWWMSGHYGLSSTFLASMKKSATLGRRAVDGPYIKSPGATENKNGAVYVVAGHAQSLYPASIAPLNHPAHAVNIRALGSVVVDVNADQLDFRMVQSDGAITDSFAIVKPYDSTDTDGDGLPDEYESEHGLNPATSNGAEMDSDGDGVPDIQEYHMGTHPLDAESAAFSRINRAANGHYRVTFPTVTGRRYTVESQSTLGSGNNWTPLGPEVLGTGLEMTVEDTLQPYPAKRFYRIRTRP